MFDQDDILIMEIFKLKSYLSYKEFLCILRDNCLPFKKEWIYLYVGKYFNDGNVKDWEDSLNEDFFLDYILDSYTEEAIERERIEIIQKLEDAYSDYSFIQAETIKRMVYYNFWKSLIHTRDKLIENRIESESNRQTNGWDGLQDDGRSYLLNSNFCAACESAPCRCSDPIN